MAKDTDYLLIARKDGSSSSRRQRGFPSMIDVTRAIERWQKQGFNTWWLYGPRSTPIEDRPELRQWRDEAAPVLSCAKCGQSYAPDRSDFCPHNAIVEAGRDREPQHPLTAEPTNEARAARVNDALLAYERHCFGTENNEDLATVVQDFLTDVFHWLRQHDLDAADITQRAANMVQAEVEMETPE